MTSNLYDKIYNDMKEAMKTKDQQKVLLLRGLISAVKNATVNAGKDITDDAVLSAVKKNLKEIEQSIDSFCKAGRDSEVENLNNDKCYLMELLPKQQISVVVETERVDEIVKIIKEQLYTGHIGDGKIFIYQLDNVIRVRTGDEGVDAL